MKQTQHCSSGLSEKEVESLDEAWSRLETVLGASSNLGVSDTLAFSQAILEIIHLNVKQRKEWLSGTAKRLRELRSTNNDLLEYIQATSQQNADNITDVTLLKRLASHLLDPDRRHDGLPAPPSRTRKLSTALPESFDESSPWNDVLALVNHLRMENLQKENEPYLSLKKPPVWIDSIIALDDLISSHLTGAPLVAVDTEWINVDVLSTLQLAVDDDVWVVDLLKEEANYQLKCKTFIRNIFETNRFVLGFAIANDLQKLQAFVGVPRPTRGTGDQRLLWTTATAVGDAATVPVACILDVQKLFVHSSSGDVPGLARCVAQLPTATSRSLSKAMQCSAWDQRPLDDNQLEYAALDAVILAYIVSEKGRHTISAVPNGQ
jgi:3'-5' exonuclease